ncbi:MAG: SH3 domain-containing protein, partial [Chloroflexota bacterium]
MRKPLLLFLMLALCATPMMTTGAQPPPPCPPGFEGYAQPRLMPGAEGIVLPGGANRVRSAPNTSGEVLGNIPSGDTFITLRGPSCTDGIVWFEVDANGLIGWTAESVDGEYFVQPTGAGRTINIPTPPEVPPAAARLPELILDSSAVHMTFTRGGTLLIAATTEPGVVDMWDVDTGSMFEIGLAPQDAPIIFYEEKLQPDGMGGDTIVTGDIQGRVFIWN